MESLKSIIDRHISASGFKECYQRCNEPVEIDEFYRHDYADVGGTVMTSAFRGSLQDVTESIVTAVEETKFDLYVEPRSYVDSIKECPLSDFSWLLRAMAGFSDRIFPEDDPLETEPPKLEEYLRAEGVRMFVSEYDFHCISDGIIALLRESTEEIVVLMIYSMD